VLTILDFIVNIIKEVFMNNIEKEYASIKSNIKSPSPLTQEAYHLQAKVECAAENGDSDAQQYFTEKIETLVKQNPSLNEDFNDLAKYLGV
jgi:hypothetical protein